MPMRFAFFSFLLCLPFSSFALETDNYLAWNRQLRDSSTHLNQYLSDSIGNALANIPDHETKSCEEMTSLISKQFESHLVHDNPVENWLFRVLTNEELYPDNLHYVEDSIYREPYRFYIPWFGLAPTIQVNGYYFGTDKLSHFSSTGMIYYKIFQTELRRRNSQSIALKKAIDWGVRDEKTLHGFWASGVFSYGDLEANFQGMRFYQRFCSGRNSYLQKSRNGEWILSVLPDIREFINGSWDESFLLSYRKPENWKNVSVVLKNNYCEKFQSIEVQKRFSYYTKTLKLSESQEYLSQLNSLPVAQSFTALCSE